VEINRTQTTPAIAKAKCDRQPLLFHDLGSRKVVADFSDGLLSVDGGALLLRQVDLNLKLSHRVAACFSDYRVQRCAEHSLPELIAQRLNALCLGYEDLNDHNSLRLDPLFAAAAGKIDPLGLDRRLPEDRGKALASPSTLNRMEISSQKISGDHKLPCNSEKMEALVLGIGLEALDRHAKKIILDFDATDDLLHGNQEGAFYNGYFRNYCYLPSYACVGDIPLWAQLQTSDCDGSDGSVEALKKIIPVLRQRCPKAKIILRADSGFSREKILIWCETNGLLRWTPISGHWGASLSYGGGLLEMCISLGLRNQGFRCVY
jgi:hypothetical protein